MQIPHAAQQKSVQSEAQMCSRFNADSQKYGLRG